MASLPQMGGKIQNRLDHWRSHTLASPPGISTDFGHVDLYIHPSAKRSVLPLPNPVMGIRSLGLALPTLSWDKNWDSHSSVNGYPSFYHRIALVAPSPGVRRQGPGQTGFQWPQPFSIKWLGGSPLQCWQGVSLSALETAGKPAHQSVNDGGSAPECSWVPASTQISGSVSDVWQRCGGVVHHQRRGNQIVQTDLPDDSFPQVLRPEGHQACANSPSRFTQHPGRCSLACGPDPSNRMAGFFIQCSPHGEHQWSICMWLLPTEICLSSHHHSWTRGPNTSMPCQLCGMGMVYTLPPFKMLPTVLNKIHSSHDLSVILAALRLMAASWMPELLKQAGCLPIPLEGHPLLKQEVWTPGGHVERRHYQPSNLHAWLLSGICLSSSFTTKASQIASAPIWRPTWLVTMSPTGADSWSTVWENASTYLR